eukprot:scaffold178143_cov10-Tisochrysis_lutea.AAC.1
MGRAVLAEWGYGAQGVAAGVAWQGKGQRGESAACWLMSSKLMSSPANFMGLRAIGEGVLAVGGWAH